MTVAGVVLAAGGASRWDGPGHKLLARVSTGSEPATTVVATAVRAALDAGLDEVIVVDGALDLTAELPPTVTMLHNEHWRDGQATSLAMATDHAAAAGHDAVVVGLGDQPGLTAAAWRAVASSTASIAVARYGAQVGQPVRLAAAVWPQLARNGDEGARTLMHRCPELVAEVPCPGNPVDIDTLGDLQRWISSTNSP